MKCPQCEATLVMSDRAGVEIDYCPQCRGVWLDRGELDKIIERSAREMEAPRDMRDTRDMRDMRGPREEYRQQGYQKKKKKNWLGEMFEFGD